MTLEQAIAFAAQIHEGQTDKAGAPYILHPLRVMARMETEAQRRVAVLHDVVEDGGVGLDVLRRRRLPEAEVLAISALSKRETEHGELGYELFIERVALDPLAARVKLGDLADNMDLGRLPSPTPEDTARTSRYERAHRRLLEALGGR